MHFFLIDINYTNNAWGYQNYGHLISSNGLISKYRITDMDHDNLGNKIKSSQPVKVISEEKVKKLYDLLLKSKDGSIVDEESTTHDAGGQRYTGYIFTDSEAERVELSLTGDYTIYNNSSAAKELVKEIKDLLKYLPEAASN